MVAGYPMVNRLMSGLFRAIGFGNIEDHHVTAPDTIDRALDKLTGLITTKADRNIVVFNPLARTRTDVARLEAKVEPGFLLRDAVTGKDVPHQTLAEGSIVFVAAAGNDGVSIDTTPFYPAALDSPSHRARP